MRDIPESDWKLWRALSKEALERYCQKTLTEVSKLEKGDESAHARYLKLWQLIKRRDKEIGEAFDDPRRSRAHLQALAAAGLGHAISVGGALGLLHYVDYRSTHDVDAWWVPETPARERERVLQVIRDALQPSGDIRTRKWGEVDVSIDSLNDLVASKMVALVERGAPRDFRDIYVLCRSDLPT